VDEEKSAEYPLGIPKTLNDVDVYFLLEELFDGMMELTRSLPPSGLAYLHLFPPHYPFAPQAEYVDMFKGGWQPATTPPAYFLTSVGDDVRADALEQRDLYDAYIATVDNEFGRLFDFMQREGILDRNYVVLTSDHGEIYERGVFGHTNEYLYEPLIHVPLVISSPGQDSQVDIHSPTSSVDLVPTLLYQTGRPLPPACEGVLLPGLGGVEDSQRPIYAIDAKNNSVRGPINNATFSLRKGRYKLIGYYGYEGYSDGFELFDLVDDPAELENLSKAEPKIFSELRAELDAKFDEINTF
jgi:arylsulfatase A-like enzyme